jgi:hypothetical protein
MGITRENERQSLIPVRDRRTIDMKRADFCYSLLSISVFVLLVAPIIATARQNDDTAAIDAYISQQARRERGEEYREGAKSGHRRPDARRVPETVVLYTIEGQHGTNLSIQYLAVFVRREGKLTVLTHADVGGRGKSARGVELTSVENDAILLDTLDYGPKDAACCPSVKGKTRYILSGKLLREQKHGPSQTPHS